ncbi:hypothetical protein Hanom_Chr01g00013961 [Helianthus anomalus]
MNRIQKLTNILFINLHKSIQLMTAISSRNTQHIDPRKSYTNKHLMIDDNMIEVHKKKN